MKSLFVVIACFVCLVYGGGSGGGTSGKGGGFRKPSCTIDGVLVPAGVTQRVGCRFCFCGFDGTAECTTFGDEGTCPTTKCAAPFVPNGKCCPVCPSLENPEFPALSGHGNNKGTPSRGSVGTRLLRFAPPAYADGFSTPRQTDPALPTAREVSQGMSGQATDKPDPRGLTAWVWQWGQFLDHDITLVTELVEHAENFDIPVFDCELKGLNPSCADSSIHFQRANWARETGTGPTNFRQHVNSISTFVDASNVYGSDYFTNTKLRTGSNGKMKVHKDKDAEGGDMMPSNLDEGITMAALDPSKEHFAAGDIRANEQQLLATIHTIWVREHNRWADNLAATATTQGWDDERHFQEARKRVIAEMQIITFDEWLPSILGSSLPKYTGYQPNLEPGMTTEFVGAFYRFGHSMIRGDYPHLGNNFQQSAAKLTLEDLFFDSKFFIDKTHSVNGFARGISATRAQAIDVFAVDALRNNLFDLPLDLVALNVQRGRDMGIPSLNDVRRALGLEPHASFDDISTDSEIRTRLTETYYNVEQVDPWIGALAEDPFYGSAGETLGKVLIDQFTRLRDGDRFFWLNWLNEQEQAEVAGFSLKKLLVNNGMTEFNGVSSTNLFFCQQGTKLFNTSNGLEACTTACNANKVDCKDAHNNVIGFAYRNPNDGCQPYACPCEACTHTTGGAVCGSDGTTYTNICALEQAQCSQSSLRYLHPGDCFDQVVTYFAGDELEIQQSVYGGPLLVEGQLHAEGKGNGRDYAIHFVDNCNTQTQLNPFASPQLPVPPVAHLTTDDSGEVREVLTEDVIISDVGTSSWLGGIDRSTVRTVDHSILNKAILFQDQSAGTTNDACYPIEGPPFVVMTAELKQGNSDKAAVSLSSSLQGGDTNIQTTVASNTNGPILPTGKYELRLSPDNCNNNNPGIMNYAVPPGEFGVPPVAEFEIHQGAAEDTFAFVNDRLKLIGSRTPINSFLRLFDVSSGNIVGCGVVTLQEDPSECLLDNTANGGKGKGKGSGNGGGNGGGNGNGKGGGNSNLKEGEVISSNADHVVYGNQAESAGMQGFLQSATGVILLCTLIVILTVALIFVVIVAYVRSNPYTAPSALKRVASVTGDIRPTTPRG